MLGRCAVFLSVLVWPQYKHCILYLWAARACHISIAVRRRIKSGWNFSRATTANLEWASAAASASTSDWSLGLHHVRPPMCIAHWNARRKTTKLFMTKTCHERLLRYAQHHCRSIRTLTAASNGSRWSGRPLPGNGGEMREPNTLHIVFTLNQLTPENERKSLPWVLYKWMVYIYSALFGAHACMHAKWTSRQSGYRYTGQRSFLRWWTCFVLFLLKIHAIDGCGLFATALRFAVPGYFITSVLNLLTTQYRVCAIHKCIL